MDRLIFSLFYQYILFVCNIEVISVEKQDQDHIPVPNNFDKFQQYDDLIH